MLRFVYTVFIGVLLATFIGVGIAAFYPSPKPPQPSPRIVAPPDFRDSSISAQYLKEQEQFNLNQQNFQKENEIYNRNVSIISVIASIAILALSLTALKQLMADGFLLGGLLTLVYSIFRGFNAHDEIFRFIVVTIGLAIALILGYTKFNKGK